MAVKLKIPRMQRNCGTPGLSARAGASQVGVNADVYIRVMRRAEVCVFAETGERARRGDPVHTRAAPDLGRPVLLAKLLPLGSGGRRGGAHVLYELRQDGKPERAPQHRVRGLRQRRQGEDALPRPQLGQVRDRLAAVPHDW